MVRRRRPKGSPEARRVTLTLKVSAAEKTAWQAEAKRRRVSLSELIRLRMAGEK